MAELLRLNLVLSLFCQAIEPDKIRPKNISNLKVKQKHVISGRNLSEKLSPTWIQT